MHPADQLLLRVTKRGEEIVVGVEDAAIGAEFDLQGRSVERVHQAAEAIAERPLLFGLEGIHAEQEMPHLEQGEVVQRLHRGPQRLRSVCERLGELVAQSGVSSDHRVDASDRVAAAAGMAPSPLGEFADQRGRVALRELAADMVALGIVAIGAAVDRLGMRRRAEASRRLLQGEGEDLAGEREAGRAGGPDSGIARGRVIDDGRNVRRDHNAATVPQRAFLTIVTSVAAFRTTLALSKQAAAPSVSARSAAALPGVTADDSTTTGRGADTMRSASSVRPSVPGIAMSSVSTSGERQRIAPATPAASETIPTTAMSRSREKICSSIARIVIESSTIRALLFKRRIFTNTVIETGCYRVNRSTLKTG